MIHNVKLIIGQEELVLETGRMAKQANGAVYARYAGSAVLATICCSDKEREELDFIPLSVEYNEKYYAAGKIPGGFLKREARPKDKEILVSRLIDRPMRPLFSKLFKREIQIIPTTISTDQVNPPDVLAMVAASAAVVISDIPFAGPMGAVRICSVNDTFIINPTFDQIKESDLEILVAGTEEGITMVEGGGSEIPEELMTRAISTAHETIKEICRIQHQLVELAGKTKLPLKGGEEGLTAELKNEIIDSATAGMEKACFAEGKENRYAAIRQVVEETVESFTEKVPEELTASIHKLLEELESDIVRKSIIKKKIRTDGRGPEDIRQITCEIDILPRTHGSALFTRGETQALAVTTLGTIRDEQIMDDLEGDIRKSFMLHYNFPPYSVGEVKRLFTGRREIGHGHLAERSLKQVLPANIDFPYTIRVVSDVLESNGSSSMATVCGGTLCLLNAGVPLSAPVAGIAMGLVKDGSDYVILSDILGEEDHLGDMDFKVAGTAKGITAFQMDIKIGGVEASILSKALEQARTGRLHILEIMNKTIEKPRDSISDYAPKIITFQIAEDKIGMVIGPGGKMIKSITAKTEAT
ncbi:MAG: polyribonucleotide nucleotidyltransferase, partial [Spirochaeta sp.]|nr:polyribonucleotide nucleotidyltransferase [Spirochaeta sp.]